MLIDQGAVSFQENKIWMFMMKKNILLCYDVDSNSFVSATIIPNEKKEKNALFNDMVIDGNVLYLIPGSAEDIYSIELKKKQINRLYIDKNKFSGNMFFCGAERFENYIFNIPSHTNGCITVIDTNSKKIIDYIKCNGIKEGSLFYSFARINDIIYITLLEKNYLIKFDCKSSAIEKIKVCDKGFFTYICVLGEDLVLVDEKQNELLLFSVSNRMIIKRIKMPYPSAKVNSIDEKNFWVDSTVDERFCMIDRYGKIVFEHKKDNKINYDFLDCSGFLLKNKSRWIYLNKCEGTIQFFDENFRLNYKCDYNSASKSDIDLSSQIENEEFFFTEDVLINLNVLIRYIDK